VRLFAEFVSGEMISLTVSRGGRGVGVGRKAMEFCGSIVRALWHGVSPAILDAVMRGCSLSDHLSIASDPIRCQRNSATKMTPLLSGILLGVPLISSCHHAVAVLGMQFRSLGVVIPCL
jgi:hypothetical protein